MTSQELEELKKALKAQLESLTAGASEHASNLARNHSSSVLDASDKSIEENEIEIETTVAGSEGNLAAKIAYALERIEAGTYEQCEDCGQTIPLERLRAKPSVSRCLKCQEEKESNAGALS